MAKTSWILRIVAIASAMWVLQCSDDTGPQTEILLTITSTARVELVEIRARNANYDSDTLTENLGTRNIIAEPLILLIRPSSLVGITDPAPAAANDFTAHDMFIHTIGFLNGVETVAAAELLEFVEGQRVVVEIQMKEGFNDADGDGFEACNEIGCDCNDQNPLVNPFTFENCNDQVDNNCSGLPINEGCACRIGDPPVACTILPDDLLHLAGIGACTLGLLECIDDGDGDPTFGILESNCAAKGAGTFTTEVPGNEIDDDCDGDVDEGDTCSAGARRECFLGLVGPAAISRMPPQSECEIGEQLCDASGRWGSCLGETRPQPNPTGVGWIELPPDPATSDPGQCDGRDNDCDGFFDEEPYFDGDSDGYTQCGTNIDVTRPGCDPGNPVQAECKAPGVSAEYIDCQDGDVPNPSPPNAAIGAERNPGQTEMCNNSVDEDCRCDHDSLDRAEGTVGSEIGLPYNLVDNTTNCGVTESYLSCALADLPRSVQDAPGDSGTCSDPPTQYYYGYFPDDISGDCYYCGELYGYACGPDPARCTLKSEDCNPCGSRDSLTPPEARPFCAVPDLAGCLVTEPARWTYVLDDPNGECPPFRCEQSDTDGPAVYHGLDLTIPDAPLCFSAADVVGSCDGAGSCRTKLDECGAAPQGNLEPNRPACMKPTSGTCEGTTAPDYLTVFVNRHEDPYDECPGTCDGAGACHAQRGEVCNATTLCEQPDVCVDGRCCEAACDTACAACSNSLTGVANGTCAPISAQVTDVEPGQLCDSSIGCTGSACVCEPTTGQCKRDNGVSCAANAECASGYCRGDWDGSGDFCAQDDTSCVDDDGGTVSQHPNGWVECDGGDAYRICTNGVWGSQSGGCDASTCNSGCGYITDGDNACVSGQGLGSAGGCEYDDLSSGVSCVDCGDVTAQAGACNSGLANCSTACGSVCQQGQTNDSGVNVCNGGAQGDSDNRIDICSGSGQSCSWSDNGSTNDTPNQNCGDIDCNTGAGNCYASCGGQDSRCNTNFHCEPDGACYADLPTGSVCNENSDCISNRCRTDWDGAGQFCAQDDTSCVDDDGGTIRQWSNGRVECDGTDGYRSCTNGVWSGSATQCNATTCNSGCGYVTDADNNCVSGTSATGGCDFDLGSGFTCIDCGELTASASGCNTGLSACSTACGATCSQGQTNDSLTNYCNPDVNGDSWNQIDICAVAAQNCFWSDNGSANDSLNAACGGFDCTIASGNCVTNCSGNDALCNTGWHCNGTNCVQDALPGESCNNNNDCSTGYCRDDWDGTGRYCAANSSNCVDYDSGALATQRADGWIECDGGDAYRTCSTGVWSALSSACDAVTCAGGCGYISDADNQCVSGAGAGSAGCEVDFGGPTTCVDCGHMTASPGSCDTGVANCSAACGAPCIAGQLNDSGVNVCNGGADGDSENRIDRCSAAATTCSFTDNGATDDTSNQNCGDIDCSGGECLGSCAGNDTLCNTNFHCEPDNLCYADLADGLACDENSDCINNFCRLDWDQSGDYCAQDGNSCVDRDGGTTNQHPNGWEECDGSGDGWRSCGVGVWTAETQCDATTCNPGGEAANCGWASDANNDCVSGASGGCSVSSCTDCGDVTATASGCNTGVSACTVVCGAACVESDLNPTGTYYCNSGNSWEQVDICSEAGTVCSFTDDGAANDIETVCGSGCNNGTGLCN